MVILGLDPGFASCGWALLDMRGAQPLALASGVIRTKATTSTKKRKCEDNVHRLQLITDELAMIHKKHRFALIAAEAQSWTRHPNSDRAIAMVWGVIASVAELYNCPVIQIRPQDVKAYLVKDATASKAALQAHVERNVEGAQELLARIPASQQNHASDAMACALASTGEPLVKAVLRIRSA